jgi:hypothetical protein
MDEKSRDLGELLNRFSFPFTIWRTSSGILFYSVLATFIVMNWNCNTEPFLHVLFIYLGKGVAAEVAAFL